MGLAERAVCSLGADRRQVAVVPSAALSTARSPLCYLVFSRALVLWYLVEGALVLVPVLEGRKPRRVRVLVVVWQRRTRQAETQTEEKAKRPPPNYPPSRSPQSSLREKDSEILLYVYFGLVVRAGARTSKVQCTNNNKVDLESSEKEAQCL